MEKSVNHVEGLPESLTADRAGPAVGLSRGSSTAGPDGPAVSGHTKKLPGAPRSRTEGRLSVVRGDEPKASRLRLQIEVNDATQEALTRLQEQTSLASAAQVVRVAVHLLDELVREQRSGASLLVVRDGEHPQKLKLVF